ncbi:hypothetical protein [Aeromonas jandaei]|uniref:hypothetical protein n=1 Tax=Aeromonas jandaei TaxID=650 RepID=UPI003B9EFB19
MESKDTKLLTPEQRRGGFWNMFLISIAVLGILTGIVICCVVAYGHYLTEDFYKTLSSIVFTMVVILFWMKIIQFVDMFFRRFLLCSYIIDESDPNVVKLFGTVRLLDLGHAKYRLLSIRSNYKIEPNAHELYGCTMAAVPASEEHLAARAELKEWGIKV